MSRATKPVLGVFVLRIYSTCRLFDERQTKRSSNTRKQHQEHATHIIITSRESVSPSSAWAWLLFAFLSQHAQSATSAYGSSATNVAIAARIARIVRPAEARSPFGPASFADARAPIFIVAHVRAGETFAAAFRAGLCRIFRRRNALVAFAATLVLVRGDANGGEVVRSEERQKDALLSLSWWDRARDWLFAR